MNVLRLPCRLPRRSRPRGCPRRLALALLLALGLPTAGRATTYTWIGGFPFSVNGDWTTGNNWSSQGVPVSAADTDLVFGATTSGGTGRTVSNNNLANPFVLRTLTFTSAAPAYTLTGSPLNLGSGGIVQNSAAAQSINNGITLTTSQSWSFGAGAGALNLGEVAINASTLSLATSGTITTGNFYLGLTSAANVVQSAGNLTISGQLPIGTGSGGNSTYTLSGGSLTVNSAAEFLGYAGNGRFVQTGGIHSVQELQIGAFFNGILGSGSGSYLLGGGTLAVSGIMYLGRDAATAVFTQNGGTASAGAVNLSGTTAATSTAYHLNGGSLTTGAVSSGAGTNIFNFNGGTLRANLSNTDFMTGLTRANVRDGGAIFDTAGFNITIAQPLLHSNIAGDAATDGGLTKIGAGRLTLTGTNTYTGGTTVSGGILSVSSDANLGAASGAVTLQNGAQLAFTGSGFFSTGRTFNLNSGTVNSGNAQLSGATVNGGFITGTSTLDGATFNNVTTLLGSSLSITPVGATLNSVTLRGNLTVTRIFATVNFNNGLVTGSGTLTVGSGNAQVPATFRTTGTEIQGVTAINAGGTVANSGTSLYLTGGSRTTIAAGGTLSTTSGTTIELNGSLLVNNGTQTGVLNVNFGSLAKGGGLFGTVNLGDGGRFSPGNSPGTATVANIVFGGGGRYDFELSSAFGTAGVTSDLLQVTNTLTLGAGNTPNSRFTIGVLSLNGSNQAAPLTDFDASQSYRFLLAQAGTINGFSAGEFAIDTSGFANGLGGGAFSVVQEGSSLYLQFSPVPEPGTWALVALGLAAGAVLRRQMSRRV